MNEASAGNFLARLSAKLASAGIAHMVVGSFASSFHGVPRSSQDLDLVIDPDERQLRQFLVTLPNEEYYADADAAFDALRRRSQFNVIDMATAWKADLIIRKTRAFSIEEMRRSIEGEILGTRLSVASPEDTIVAKIECAKAGGGSDLQLRDAAGILAVRGAALDLSYIEHWIEALELGDFWDRVRREAAAR
jgi:hypothetical protein